MNTALLIRKLRAEHKISQQELADRAGVSFSFVNQVEGGKSTVRLDALNRLLKFFGYQMVAQPTALQKAIQEFEKDEAPVQSFVQTASEEPAESEELPPVTIHKPKDDWSFF